MRFVVDAGVVLRLAAEDLEPHHNHELLAPTLIRSQTLSALHEQVHTGKLDAELARERIQRVNATKLRLLRDAVLRRLAWEVADRLDKKLARAAAAALVETEAYDALFSP